ncbi:hypothetical protein OPT61_g4585 [Boeremia exigua]|uniref:Uncharacterized protein n=1 Tax=Boeremia exigua TaxID=749465 RepID=A0ACC2IDF7_9PLEO|nr:hypothetical protein OPT61_g4585 [Boeremia exigua]
MATVDHVRSSDNLILSPYDLQVVHHTTVGCYSFGLCECYPNSRGIVEHCNVDLVELAVIRRVGPEVWFTGFAVAPVDWSSIQETEQGAEQDRAILRDDAQKLCIVDGTNGPEHVDVWATDEGSHARVDVSRHIRGAVNQRIANVAASFSMSVAVIMVVSGVIADSVCIPECAHINTTWLASRSAVLPKGTKYSQLEAQEDCAAKQEEPTCFLDGPDSGRKEHDHNTLNVPETCHLDKDTVHNSTPLGKYGDRILIEVICTWLEPACDVRSLDTATDAVRVSPCADSKVQACNRRQLPSQKHPLIFEGADIEQSHGRNPPQPSPTSGSRKQHSTRHATDALA